VDLAAADIHGEAQFAAAFFFHASRCHASGWRRDRGSAPVHRDLEFARRNENSGCTDDHWRRIRRRTRVGHSSAAAPAKWSAVTLRMQLPLVWMACILDARQIARIAGMSDSAGQLKLDVLSRREMAVASCRICGRCGQACATACRSACRKHRDAQHVGVKLQVDPVHQP